MRLRQISAVARQVGRQLSAGHRERRKHRGHAGHVEPTTHEGQPARLVLGDDGNLHAVQQRQLLAPQVLLGRQTGGGAGLGTAVEDRARHRYQARVHQRETRVGFGQPHLEAVAVQRAHARHLDVEGKRRLAGDDLAAQLKQPRQLGVLAGVEVLGDDRRIKGALEAVDAVGRRQFAWPALAGRVVGVQGASKIAWVTNCEVESLTRGGSKPDSAADTATRSTLVPPAVRCAKAGAD